MILNHPCLPARSVRAFVLPAVLIVVSALLIMAVGMMTIAGLERKTARTFVDRQRADLAVRAGLEELRSILNAEADNDDFLIIAGWDQTSPRTSLKDPIPYLYLARGKYEGRQLSYRYVPLFSSHSLPGETTELVAPDANGILGDDFTKFEVFPWMDQVPVAWIPLRDEQGKTIARYAFWVEDLQSKLDPRLAEITSAERTAWPEPASAPRVEGLLAPSSAAIHLLDPNSTERSPGTLAHRLVVGRTAMISPESVLGATGIVPPLIRDPHTGRLLDELAASLEKNLSPTIQHYDEQPLVPFATGIDSAASGLPKLNLNRLLTKPRVEAVDELALWIDRALPEFVTRKGGFPDNYLKTLAANALDYADSDSVPSLVAGSFRGIDGFPFLSEIVLGIQYLGPRVSKGRLILEWKFSLYAELWNITNLPVSGDVSLSYEVGLNPTSIGGGTRGRAFDDPRLLNDPQQSTHQLRFSGGRFYTPPMKVDLQPDQYRLIKFADVSYAIDSGPGNTNWNTKFTLEEREGEARGISLRWNDVEVERLQAIVRDPFGMDFTILYPAEKGKAAIAGHSYGPYGDFINNMGDPRMSHYLRTIRLGENAFPGNISPHRRNVRRATIYDGDHREKRLHYGRVMPSEWPDGGHDSPLGDFSIVTMASFESAIAGSKPQTDPANAPMRISNAGRFYSAVELGNVYDPVMWHPTYPDREGIPGSGAVDSFSLNGPAARMPITRNRWPEVSAGSEPSDHYGGGNTLRIGRPEHEWFDRPGLRSSQLLDLFQVGKSASSDRIAREGATVEIKGHVNLNTAGEDVIRALAAGLLKQDPELRRVTEWAHETTTGRYSPRTEKAEFGAPTQQFNGGQPRAADLVAEAIVNSRPFASAADVANSRDREGRKIFGNPAVYQMQASSGVNDPKLDLRWSDAAAEEIFGRVYDSSTLRSRNFRIWVIGQTLAPSEGSSSVVAESRKVFTVFANPGERDRNGKIHPDGSKVKVLYENDF